MMLNPILESQVQNTYPIGQESDLQPYQGLFFASAQNSAELKSIVQAQLDSRQGWYQSYLLLPNPGRTQPKRTGCN